MLSKLGIPSSNRVREGECASLMDPGDTVESESDSARVSSGPNDLKFVQ